MVIEMQITCFGGPLNFLSISGRFFVNSLYLSFVWRYFLSTICGRGVNDSVCVFEVDLAPKMSLILTCFFVNLLLHVRVGQCNINVSTWIQQLAWVWMLLNPATCITMGAASCWIQQVGCLFYGLVIGGRFEPLCK